MLPVWEDVLRGGMFELSNKVRRSNFSYELHGSNNLLRIFPVPTQQYNLFFTYNLLDATETALDPSDPASNGAANVSNVPFGNIEYGRSTPSESSGSGR